MKKRLLSILLVATMLLAMIPAVTVAASAETTVTDWNAPEIVLMNADDFKEFRKQFAAGNTFVGRTVKLGADIDLANENLLGVGSAHGFMGTFDGQNHVIRNLLFSRAEGYQGALFGTMAVADKGEKPVEIKNFALVNATVIAGARAGVLYATAYADVIVENVHLENVSLKGSGNASATYFGYVGQECNVIIRNCTLYNGSVINDGTDYYKGKINEGAFVGQVIDETSTVTLENCLNYSVANASTDVTAVDYIGYYPVAANITIKTCIDVNKDSVEQGIAAQSYLTTNGLDDWTALHSGYPVPTTLALPFFSAKMIDWTADEIEIVTADQFVEFKQQIENANYFVGKTVKLGADIDLTGRILAANNDTDGFYGTFDGQFHTISNLTFSNTRGSYQGVLFGAVDEDKSVLNAEESATVKKNGITIKNFSLINSTIVSNARTSTLYAWVFATLTVENVYIDADVTGTTDCVGGFIGDAAVGTITFKNCIYEGTTKANDGVGCGAFVGRIRNDKTTTVVNMENCLNVSEASWTGCYYENGSSSFDSNKKENLTNSYCYDATEMGEGFTATTPDGFTARNASYPVPTTLLPFFADEVANARTAKTEALATEYYGIQNTENKDAVRFVGVVNGADTDFQRVGFEIVAIRDNGNVWSDTIEIQNVYSSVLEDGQSKSAADCGGDFIFVAAITNMAANKGVVNFAVKAFSVDTNGVKTYNDMVIISFDTSLAA